MSKTLLQTGLMILFLFTLLPPSEVQAQFRCGFDGVMQQLRKENPGHEAELNKKVKDYLDKRRSEAGRMSALPGTLYHIPVVVHVVHTGLGIGTTYNPTDATIQSAIDYLNAVFNGTWTGTGGAIQGAGDLQIQFVLATIDPNGNPTTGINRVDGTSVANYNTSGIAFDAFGQPVDLPVKNLSRWDPAAYYNIWIVNRINGQDGTVPNVAFTAGYAYFPYHNNSAAASLQKDGIVMLATQMRAGQKTLPHEFGHAFNLYHTFEEETNVTGALNTCAPNSSPTTQGDLCTDTDPVINPADDGYGSSAFSCRTGTNPCTGLPYADNTEKNFMNYTGCYQLFTNDQRDRMQASMETTTREGLVSSWANNQSTYPTTWTVPLTALVTPTTSSSYANYLGIMNVKLNNKKIFTLNATQDGGYVDNAKWYNLFALQPNTTYTMEIGLNNSGNSEQLGVWIDYNGDGVFNNTNERAYYSNNHSPTSLRTISITTPSSLSGNIVRMRVMNDFSIIYGDPAINGSTTTLVGGQAEDYPVYLMNNAPLPLTLLDFGGTTASGNSYLTWKTSEEINTKEYVVQRSSNGRDYSTIGSVAAKGHTVSETTYRFTDFGISSGAHLYRLKMVDEDNSFSFSKTIQVSISTPSAVQVIGNPFTDHIKLGLPDHQGPVFVRLLDAMGKVIMSRTITQSGAHSSDLPIDQHLSKGLYILETVVNNQRAIHKLVKE